MPGKIRILDKLPERCLNPFDDEYYWYLAKRDSTDLTPREKKELRNKAIIFLSQHGYSRNQCCVLFGLGATMISTIVASAPEGTNFASKYYKITQQIADEIREKSRHYTGKELAVMYNVSNGTISEILNNKRWVRETGKN